MATRTPERSLQQRMAALTNANQVRVFRSNLKKDLKAGRKSTLDLLLDPPPEVETMKVFDVILSTPRYGRVKTNKLLQLVRMSPTKTIGGLTQRQQTELVARLMRR